MELPSSSRSLISPRPAPSRGACNKRRQLAKAAPRNTPTEIIDRLNKEVNAGLADSKIKARIADLGNTVFAGSPADFGKLIAEETEKWAKVVKFSGAKSD
jgi:tripartite-type tricarboxylate transporter receptor subunit TctC